MGLFKHVITKSIDTHFDKQIAANVGINSAKMQNNQNYAPQGTVPQYQNVPNNPNLKIANPQLYANWQAQQHSKQLQENDNQNNTSQNSSDALMAKKAELMTELIRQGKTPEEALEFANIALKIE